MNFKQSYKKCRDAAEKCVTKYEFREKYKNEYQASWRNNWLKDFTWLKHKTYEENKNDKIYVVYSYEILEIKSVYVGLSCNIKRRDRQHRFGIKSSKGMRYSKLHKVISESGFTLPKPNIIYSDLSAIEAQDKENLCILSYKENGWNIINIAKTGKNIGSLGNSWIKWNEEMCFKEALKYERKCDFKKNASGAYAASVKNDWYKNYTWFGKNKNNNTHKRNYWNYENCFNEALKYKSKKEFEKNNETAAKKAYRNKWMKDYLWFKNDKKERNYWNYENCKAAAKKCKTRTEFARNYDTAYKKSLKNNWLKEFYDEKQKT